MGKNRTRGERRVGKEGEAETETETEVERTQENQRDLDYELCNTSHDRKREEGGGCNAAKKEK